MDNPPLCLSFGTLCWSKFSYTWDGELMTNTISVTHATILDKSLWIWKSTLGYKSPTTDDPFFVLPENFSIFFYPTSTSFTFSWLLHMRINYVSTYLLFFLSHSLSYSRIYFTKCYVLSLCELAGRRMMNEKLIYHRMYSYTYISFSSFYDILVCTKNVCTCAHVA